MATRKVGSAGRFGSRYGKKIRVRVAQIEKNSRGKHICPRCRALKLRREAAGIWVCSKCGMKMAGGSYVPVYHGITIKK